MPQDLVSGTGGLASAQTEYDKRGYPDPLLSRGMTAWGGGPQLCAVLKDPSENSVMTMQRSSRVAFLKSGCLVHSKYHACPVCVESERSTKEKGILGRRHGTCL